MTAAPSTNITRLLLEWGSGNESALANLFPLVYEELRVIARIHLRHERSASTLQRTALVHEAFLRLVDQKSVTWQSRAHFFGLASQMMRRILVPITPVAVGPPSGETMLSKWIWMERWRKWAPI